MKPGQIADEYIAMEFARTVEIRISHEITSSHSVMFQLAQFTLLSRLFIIAIRLDLTVTGHLSANSNLLCFIMTGYLSLKESWFCVSGICQALETSCRA